LEPAESLVLVAELGVALVAAAGIVTAIGGRNRDYSPEDRVRIRSLILVAAAPLAVSLLGLALISADIPLPQTWSLVSFGTAALIVALALSTTRESARVEGQSAAVRRNTLRRNGIHFVLSGGALSVLLYNGFVLSAFWPILVVCSYQLLSAVWLVLSLLLEEH